MVLSAGARFGAYEVLELLGAGGMGEVYRARDTRLKREAFPSWSTARSELFFRNPNTQQIMVASFTAAGQSFRADKPRVWSPGLSLARPRLRPYALHP